LIEATGFTPANALDQLRDCKGRGCEVTVQPAAK
jgi:hypothetical protein